MKIEHQDDVLVLIVRNISGVADSEERNTLKEWIGKSYRNKQYFEQVRNIWDISDRRIDVGSIDTSSAFKKVHKRLPDISQKKTFWFYWQKVAAIIIIPLLISSSLWLYLNSKRASSSDFSDEVVYNEVYTPIGTRSSLRLADSTLVWLNSGSSIRYPIRFNNNDRTVYLSGEAYFEVASDKYKPFTVHTPSLEVKATGTKFSVSEHDESPLTEVTLVSGKVTVQKSGSLKNQDFIEELNPNEHFEYNRETERKCTTYGDTYRFIAWKDGILIFRDEPLESVLNKISMFFNVDFKLQGEALKSYRYHATFRDESLEEILKLLEISAPISYTEVKREPLPDGSFPKKEVIIKQAD